MNSILTNNVINNAVAIQLNKLGLSEKYIAFEYLQFTICEMITSNDDSLQFYNSCMKKIEDFYSITLRTIQCGFKHLFNSCTNAQILQTKAFIMPKQKYFNKVLTIKNFIINQIPWIAK